MMNKPSSLRFAEVTFLLVGIFAFSTTASMIHIGNNCLDYACGLMCNKAKLTLVSMKRQTPNFVNVVVAAKTLRKEKNESCRFMFLDSLSLRLFYETNRMYCIGCRMVQS